MKPVDRLLLLRVAGRVEERARATYLSSPGPDLVLAKKRRDREVGDAADIKDYVKRAEDDAACAARYRYLRDLHDVDWNALMRDGGEELDRALDAAIAKQADAKLATE